MVLPEMDLQTFVDTVNGTRVVSYMNAACIAILCYDFFDYFDREIEIIWMTRWTVTKFMYVLTRYSAFVEAGVVIYQLSIPGDWYNECALSFKINACLFVFGLGVGEIIMTTRTWAVWKKSRWLMYFLPTFYIMVWVAGFTSTGIFLSSLEFKPTPLNAYIGCYATSASPIIFVSWLLLLFYDFVMFVLMVIPAYKAFKTGGMSRLMIIVFRDGILYYLYLFVLSLLNIICTLSFPSALALVVSLFSRVLHAILACRVVLNIHEIGRPVLNESHQRQPVSNKRANQSRTSHSRTFSNTNSQSISVGVQSKPRTDVLYHIQKQSV